MHDLAVLFLHHADDAATRNNLACIRHFNPGLPIVPISNWGQTLPGGFHLRDMTRGWRKVLPSFRQKGLGGLWRRLTLRLEPAWVWRNSDLAAYLWILWKDRPVRAHRWVIVEWDVYCNTSVVDWYAPDWDKPISATCVQWPEKNGEFYFFNDRERHAIPAPFRPFIAATNPWAGMMLSDDAPNGDRHTGSPNRLVQRVLRGARGYRGPVIGNGTGSLMVTRWLSEPYDRNRRSICPKSTFLVSGTGSNAMTYLRCCRQHLLRV